LITLEALDRVRRGALAGEVLDPDSSLTGAGTRSAPYVVEPGLPFAHLGALEPAASSVEVCGASGSTAPIYYLLRLSQARSVRLSLAHRGAATARLSVLEDGSAQCAAGPSLDTT